MKTIRLKMIKTFILSAIISFSIGQLYGAGLKNQEKIYLYSGLESSLVDIISFKKSYFATQTFEQRQQYLVNNKYLWKEFDPDFIKKQFYLKLRQGFTDKEMSQLESILKNPFVGKFYDSLSFRSRPQLVIKGFLSEKLIFQDIQASRELVVKNIYNLLALELHVDRLKAIIEESLIRRTEKDYYFEHLNSEISIFGKDEFDVRMSKLVMFYINSLAKNLSQYRHYELREFVRLHKKFPLLQRFSSFYVNLINNYLLELYTRNYSSLITDKKVK